MSSLQESARRVLSRAGDGRAIRFEGRWYGWDSVRQVGRTVLDLVEASGAPPRAPVLFIARNMPSALAALLGLISGSRTISFVYSFQSPAALAQAIARLTPAVVLAAERDFSEEVRAALREGGAAAIALTEMGAQRLPGFETSTALLDPASPAQPIIEIQTSGTTGAPKRFPVSYETALTQFVQRALPSARPADGAAALPALLYMSMGNLSGMMSTLPALLLGQEIILHDRFDLDAWRDYVRTYRPKHMGLQPAAVQMLLDADVPAEELASLRTLIVGSAPLRPEAHRAFEARYGIAILLAYGATEFYGTAAAMTLELHDEWGDAKFGSVGRAVSGVRLRVVDPETGAILAPGETGLLEVYLETLKQEWIHTSDLAMLDEDNFLFMRGRADGAIIRGGFKLLPETIERGLLQHEAVAAVAVVGVADKRLGQVPGAVVQLKPGEHPDTKELERHLRQHMLATHIPVHWRFVDTFPLTPSLKVDRGALVRLFEGPGFAGLAGPRTPSR